MFLSPIHSNLFYTKKAFPIRKTRNLFLFLFSFCFVVSCNTTTKDFTSLSTEMVLYEKVLELSTIVPEVYLRIDPSFTSDFIETLPRGTRLEGLAFSNKTNSTKRVNGIIYKEPWQQVKTEDGKIGWVYGGELMLIKAVIPTAAQNTFLQKRLSGIFGPDLSVEILQYRKTYQAISTSSTFAEVYSKGLSIRDSVALILASKAEIVDPYEPVDFSWLEYCLPGLRIELVAEATTYYPYIDYAAFLEKSNMTSGKEDDLFSQLNVAMYKDSVEQAFPSWVLQTWDYGGHSLLGSNKHFELLQLMDAIYQQTSLFNPHIIGYKDALLSDILAEWVTYSDTQEAIQKELKQIISHNFSCLTEEEQLQLQQRLVAFDNPDLHNISLGNRK